MTYTDLTILARGLSRWSQTPTGPISNETGHPALGPWYVLDHVGRTLTSVSTLRGATSWVERHLADGSRFFPEHWSALHGLKDGWPWYDHADLVVSVQVEQRWDYLDAREWVDFNMAAIPGVVVE